MKSVMFALALALTLPSCADLQSIAVGGSIGQAAPGALLTAEKSLTVAHYAYNGLSQEIINLTASGLIRGQTALSIKVWYDRAGDALKLADQADKVANAEGIVSALLQANEAVNQAAALIHSK